MPIYRVLKGYLIKVRPSAVCFPKGPVKADSSALLEQLLCYGTVVQKEDLLWRGHEVVLLDGREELRIVSRAKPGERRRAPQADPIESESVFLFGEAMEVAGFCYSGETSSPLDGWPWRWSGYSFPPRRLDEDTRGASWRSWPDGPSHPFPGEPRRPCRGGSPCTSFPTGTSTSCSGDDPCPSEPTIPSSTPASAGRVAANGPAPRKSLAPPAGTSGEPHLPGSRASRSRPGSLWHLPRAPPQGRVG